MEAFHGSRWRAGGHRRGGVNGGDRGSFNNNLGPPRQSHPHVFDGNWGRNSVTSGRGTDVWENGNSYPWNQYPCSTDNYNDLPGPMENRYNNQWAAVNQGQIVNHPRMDYPPRQSMNGHWQGRRPPRFPHHSQQHVQSPSSLGPVPTYSYNQQQSDIPSPSDQEQHRQIGSPLNSFSSPSSTDSESSSHLSRDPRNTRQRSHIHTASPLYNFQDKSFSLDNQQSSYHNNSVPPLDTPRYNKHYNQPSIHYQNASHHHESPSSFSSHHVNNNYYGNHQEYEGQRRMPTNHVSSKEPTGCYNHVYQPSHVHQRPPENPSRPFMKERIIFEHSYYNRVENNSSNTTATKLLDVDGSSHRTLMAPCTNQDIPLLTRFTCSNQFENTADSQIESSELARETVVLFEEVDKNHETDISIKQTPTNDDSNRKELDNPPSAELQEADSPSVLSVNTHTEQDDEECFQISSPSLTEFDIDIDTEKESLASRSPPLSLTGDEEQLLSVSLCVSLPLSKVSLPTNILLKPPKIDLSPALLSKDICSVVGRPTGKERVQTRESLAKQQNNTIQLRNRALPRNLYLFASRKSSPKVNSAVESNDNESDDGVDKNVSTSDDSIIVIENIDMMQNDIDESSKECTEEISMNDSTENDYDISDRLRSIRTHSESPSTSNASRAKVCKRSHSPETSPSTKKKTRFQDFVPVVFKARSRAETKTIQKRQKMVLEMEQNEKDRSSTPIAIENDEDKIPYRTRTRTRKRDKMSPNNSVFSQDDNSSSIASESIQSSKDHDTPSQENKEYSPGHLRRYQRWLIQAKNRSGSGDSPLHHVCRNGKHDVLCYLLKNIEYNVNAQDNAGWTPLHEACNKGHKNIVELLLRHGADPNIPATDGTRPIHDAVEAGNFEIVTILVKHGADPMVEHSERTPIEIAKSANFPKIVAYLSEFCEKRKQSSNHHVIQHQSEQVTKRNSTTLATIRTNHTPYITLPVDGYSEHFLGPELDHPLFFVSACIEMSSVPMLPLYNITVSSGLNPRRHNFHILIDVLKHLDITKEDLLAHSGLDTFPITVAEFITQVKNNPLTRNAKILKQLKSMNKASKLELIPLSNTLRDLMSIKMENMDD